MANDIFDNVSGFVKGSPAVWNIGFTNRAGEEDETQLDSDSAEDLRNLWMDMHDEFNADFDSILYIEKDADESAVEKWKRECFYAEVVASEVLDSDDAKAELTVEEMREILRYTGDDEYVWVDEKKNIIPIQGVRKGIMLNYREQRNITEDYWEIEYVITNYNKGFVAFIERFFKTQEEPTDTYGFWVIRDNPENIIKENRVDRFYEKHKSDGYGEDGLSLEDCFVSVIDVVEGNNEESVTDV